MFLGEWLEFGTVATHKCQVPGRRLLEEDLPHATRRHRIARRDVRRAKLFVSGSCVWSRAPESFYSRSAAAVAAMKTTRNIVAVAVPALAPHIVVKERPRLASFFGESNDDDSLFSE